MTGPLPAALSPITVPLSWVYGAVIARRNRRYDRGRGVGGVGVPVISIGNLTTGGAGKTPLVLWLAERLGERGHRPVIAMRGYGARRGEPSDEQAEYAERLPEVEVVAQPDRRAGLTAFLPRHPDVNCVLLDDGFQHRQLGRDLDLVVIDASRETLRARLLPAGHLREPPAGLRRADAVILTHADDARAGLADDIAEQHGARPLATARHAWHRLRLVAPGTEATWVDPDWLAGRRVLTLLGVGHPDAVRRQIEEAGADIAVHAPARDHERYDAGVFRRLRGQAEGLDAMVVTAKDWVKIRHVINLPDWPVPLVIPELTLDVFAGGDALTDLVLRTVEGHS